MKTIAKHAVLQIVCDVLFYIIMGITSSHGSEILKGAEYERYAMLFYRYYDLIVDRSLPLSPPIGTSFTITRSANNDIEVESITTNTMIYPFNMIPYYDNPFASPPGSRKERIFSCANMIFNSKDNLVCYSNGFSPKMTINNLENALVLSKGGNLDDGVSSETLFDITINLVCKMDNEASKYKTIITNINSNIYKETTCIYFNYITTSMELPDKCKSIFIVVNSRDGSIISIMIAEYSKEDVVSLLRQAGKCNVCTINITDVYSCITPSRVGGAINFALMIKNKQIGRMEPGVE